MHCAFSHHFHARCVQWVLPERWETLFQASHQTVTCMGWLHLSADGHSGWSPPLLQPWWSSGQRFSATLHLLCLYVQVSGFLVSLFFISSMAIDFVVWDLVGGHGQQYRGVETDTLVFSASLHLHQTHQFQVSIVAWKFNFLFGSVFKDLVSFAYLCVLYSCLPFVAMVITLLISTQLFSFEFIILCI